MDKPSYQTFYQIPNVCDVCAVLGLNFPESATDFQKSALTLAHLMASLRDFILKGIDVPSNILDMIDNLHYVMQSNCDAQR